jgi:hypothetical protein
MRKEGAITGVTADGNHTCTSCLPHQIGGCREIQQLQTAKILNNPEFLSRDPRHFCA